VHGRRRAARAAVPLWTVDWPTAEPIETPRLTLEPLRVEHAGEMAEVLADPRLYDYIGGTPPSPAQLRTRYALQVAGHSPDRRHGWLNWIVRERGTDAAIGSVQATIGVVDGR
jgi:RimJ/RimL family protein N-acetyltransferase